MQFLCVFKSFHAHSELKVNSPVLQKIKRLKYTTLVNCVYSWLSLFFPTFVSVIIFFFSFKRGLAVVARTLIVRLGDVTHSICFELFIQHEFRIKRAIVKGILLKRNWRQLLVSFPFIIRLNPEQLF